MSGTSPASPTNPQPGTAAVGEAGSPSKPNDMFKGLRRPFCEETPETPAIPSVEEVKRDRQQVYGDPLLNHQGIARMWAPLLSPWWERIRNGDPIPPHVVALLMGSLKLNRMRLVYHEDNFVDQSVYVQEFAKAWQADQTTYGPGPGPDPTR